MSNLHIQSNIMTEHRIIPPQQHITFHHTSTCISPHCITLHYFTPHYVTSRHSNLNFQKKEQHQGGSVRRAIRKHSLGSQGIMVNSILTNSGYIPCSPMRFLHAYRDRRAGICPTSIYPVSYLSLIGQDRAVDG